MPTSDKDLEKKQGEVEKLRSQIAELRAAREQREQESVNDITAVELDAEAARLRLELEREKQLAKPAVVKANKEALLGNAQATMEAAAAAEDAMKASDATDDAKKKKES